MADPFGSFRGLYDGPLPDAGGVDPDRFYADWLRQHLTQLPAATSAVAPDQAPGSPFGSFARLYGSAPSALNTSGMGAMTPPDTFEGRAHEAALAGMSSDPEVRKQATEFAMGLVGPGSIRGVRMGIGGRVTGIGDSTAAAGNPANAGMSQEAIKTMAEAQRPTTYAGYVAQHTRGMSPPEILQSDALWAKAKDLSDATGKPFHNAFAELASAAGADIGPDAARKFIAEQRGALMGVQEVPPYSGTPDSLMGFRRSGQNKGFDETNFRHEQPVRITFPDTGDTFIDAIKGLNKPHALERARRNWVGAKIEAIDPPAESAPETLNFRSAGAVPGEVPPTPLPARQVARPPTAKELREAAQYDKILADVRARAEARKAAATAAPAVPGETLDFKSAGAGRGRPPK